MDIIPAIDLIDGKCVRLSQGDYSRRTVYNEDPSRWLGCSDHGIKRLHLVDLDGAKASHIVNHRVLERLATHTSLVIDFGGGLKTDEDLKVAFESGAAW
jgi:phosphoribosylformimino-5-aminoimidazole carboxamide ribotide isomerase